MTDYNQYLYILVAGIKNFSAYIKVDETAEPKDGFLLTTIIIKHQFRLN